MLQLSEQQLDLFSASRYLSRTCCV